MKNKKINGKKTESLDSGNPKRNLKSKRTPQETQEAVAHEYLQTVQGTQSANEKLQNLIEELEELSFYLEGITKAADLNLSYIENEDATEQFNKAEKKLKDVFNLRWQHEFNMFSISQLHFLIDKLCWNLWNWDSDSESIRHKAKDLAEAMIHFIDNESYSVFDETTARAKLPLAQPVVSLWTEGSRMPAAVALNYKGYHLDKSPLGEDAHRTATWLELINPLVTWDNKNVHIVTPKYEEDDYYSIGEIAAVFDTTPFDVLQMLTEDLLRTDTEDTMYHAYKIKGSVINNFIEEMFEIKRIIKDQRLDSYREKMKSLHGGQKRLDL
jgi:hypothetical protein